MTKNKFLKIISATVFAITASTSANAYTECQTGVSTVWNDPTGALIVLTGGLAFWIPTSDASMNRTMSMAALAGVSGKAVRVRFAADGANCNVAGTRSDYVGMYLIIN